MTRPPQELASDPLGEMAGPNRKMAGGSGLIDRRQSEEEDRMRTSERCNRMVEAVLIAACLWVFGALAAAAQEEERKVYDEDADAKAEIAKAVAKAEEGNKRVLIVFGGNWCGWCVKLHDLFTNDRDISKILRYEYEVVRVDVGRFDKNLDVAEGYEAKIKSGVPYLTVLGGDGKVLTHRETGSLEKGELHDPALVKAFLEEWAAEPLDAEEVFKGALSRAKEEGKHLLVHLGAPW